MSRYRFVSFVVLLSLVSVCVLPTSVFAQEPVKVYIMMGQSNMLGLGDVTGGTDGDLDYAVNTKGLYPYLSDGLGGFASRSDVRQAHVQASGGPESATSVIVNNFLSPSNRGKLGPEHGIGEKLGNALSEDVLLLKSCIGNRSLGWDLLPPGSTQYQYNDGVTEWTYAGYGDSPDRWETGTTPVPIGWTAGIQYDGDVQRAKDVLNNLSTYYPGKTEYQIAGFFWWQGDKDRYNAGHSTRYEQNLVQLINQLRDEFNAPNAPFVAATLGQSEIDVETGTELDILNAQLNVANDTLYPAFADNVDTVYSFPLSLGGASNSHYNGNAETYMNIGEAMGDAMVSLIRTLPYLEIHQQTGEMKIVNPADSDLTMDLKDLSITSTVGALDPDRGQLRPGG
jgi:hypothetical protein